jgi:2-(1,2-epoxy-1,2-dihydrophenyl)acetyl-CoA isomerase
MEPKELILEKEGHVAVLTLNRPDKMNAISLNMRVDLPLALQQVQEDDDLRALIITGAGRGFCSGADVAVQAARAAGEQTPESLKTILQLTGALILGFEKINKPVIAAVNGSAAGVGLTLALVSDIRIASGQARFSAIWVKRGLIADGGATLLLPLIVGLEKALELAFTGDILDAREAERIGLVSKVVPPEDLMPGSRAGPKNRSQPPHIGRIGEKGHVGKGSQPVAGGFVLGELCAGGLPDHAGSKRGRKSFHGKARAGI